MPAKMAQTNSVPDDSTRRPGLKMPLLAIWSNGIPDAMTTRKNTACHFRDTRYRAARAGFLFHGFSSLDQCVLLSASRPVRRVYSLPSILVLNGREGGPDLCGIL